MTSLENIESLAARVPDGALLALAPEYSWVPMALIRAGVKLAALIPSQATDSVNEELRKKGIKFDVSSFKADDLEPLIDALQDLEVDVKDGQHKVRVFVE